MVTDRHLSPADAVVAVRSFPRRFEALLARPDDEDGRWEPDEIGRRIGTDGTSAADHVVAADGVLALTDRALEVMVAGGDQTLHPAFADLGAAEWDDAHTPVPALLEQLEATASRAADRIEAVPTDRWGARLRIADDDGDRPALSVVQDAIAVVAAHLRAAARVLAEVR